MTTATEWYGCVITDLTQSDDYAKCYECDDQAVVHVDILCGSNAFAHIKTCAACTISDRDVHSVRYQHLMRPGPCHDND